MAEEYNKEIEELAYVIAMIMPVTKLRLQTMTKLYQEMQDDEEIKPFRLVP